MTLESTVQHTEQALHELLTQAMPALRGFVRRLCGNQHDADDVLQEALTKVWRLRASFDPTQNGLALLHRAAFRCFCDLRQRQRRSPQLATTGDDRATTDTASSPTFGSELRDEMAHRLRALSELERALLLSFHRDGASLRELAQQHHLPLNTVKSHLHRARRALQQQPETS